MGGQIVRFGVVDVFRATVYGFVCLANVLITATASFALQCSRCSA
jgi:hypothetical protein